MSFAVARKDATVRTAAPYPACAPENLHDHLSLLHAFGCSSRFARNETVFQEGDRAHNVYRVVSGTVRLCRYLPDGRRHIAEFALPGDLLGVFGGGEQAFTAEAVTDAVLIAYPRAQLDGLSEHDPRFRASMLAHLTTHLLAAQLHTVILGCQSAKERLASFIVRHADRTGAMDGGRLDLSMGRQDIADHLGLTIETICRALATLKTEALIAVPNTHQLILRNVEALCELAEGSAAHQGA